MMILISGMPGNGKTLRAIALMVEERERNLAAVKAGKEQPREFFSNIEGMALDWVKPIPFAEPADTPPQQRRPDWRLCPDGSFVVYDEAHADGKTEGLEHYGVLFPGTGRPGEADDARIKAMSTHRHRGFDLVFMTQWPSKVHHTLRQLVGKHLHMNRAMGMERAGVLTWSRVQSDPYDEKQREKAEEEVWVFPREHYGTYKSATLHTAAHKFKIPPKVWSALSVAVTVSVIAFGCIKYFSPPAEAEEAAAHSQAPLGAAAPSALFGPPGTRGMPLNTADRYERGLKPRMPGIPWTAPAFDGRAVVSDPHYFCASSGPGQDAAGEHREASCTCLTEQGTPVDIGVHVCESIARRGESYNPYKAPQRKQERSWSEGPGAGQRPAAMGAPAPAPALEAEGIGGGTELAAYGGFRSPQGTGAP